MTEANHLQVDFILLVIQDLIQPKIISHLQLVLMQIVAYDPVHCNWHVSYVALCQLHQVPQTSINFQRIRHYLSARQNVNCELLRLMTRDYVRFHTQVCCVLVIALVRVHQTQFCFSHPAGNTLNNTVVKWVILAHVGFFIVLRELVMILKGALKDCIRKAWFSIVFQGFVSLMKLDVLLIGQFVVNMLETDRVKAVN